MRILRLIFLVAFGISLTAAASCTPEKALTRKEWRELGSTERTDYIDAIWCLRHLPSTLPNEEFPGARDRLDDFVVTHINYTNMIHFNGILLPWHRHFVFLWETALREECGYKGSVPYWNWALDADNLFASPVFDGSATSLSDNGVYDPNEPIPCTPTGKCFPRGTGGGCVQSGPFKHFPVHLGPLNASLARSYRPIPRYAFDYNPRCLSRSLNPYFISNYNNQREVDKMLAANSISEFLAIMSPSEQNTTSAHGAGHGTVGGSMSDLFVSPQDPSFMLHHAMIDRVWAQWQDQDPANRNALNGTTIIFDPPDAPLVTLDTLVEFGVLAPSREVRETMDPMDYGYCYAYT
ncbi:Di-copper centre-containing protein [Aspergillus coremiiformis]|uniref:Di-copper centre-containing protein n=1 Tax=Aspergillus coremiiformis TaxID=138285 RepID=A0A5N6Z0V1_9EURO|nr:Di-copper centre-containing protein [Aspergillus coremiiformis]